MCSKFDIYVLTCVAKGGSRSRNCFLRPSVPARQYLLSVICNSNSFQLILFKLCSVCIHIEDVHLLLWTDLKIFFIYFLYAELSHFLSLYWCNLKLQQCSINIIQTLTVPSWCMLNLVIFFHYMSWTVPSWCNLKLQKCSINIILTLHSVCIHIEDVHLLLWADLTILFFNFLYVELNHLLSLYDIDGT